MQCRLAKRGPSLVARALETSEGRPTSPLHGCRLATILDFSFPGGVGGRATGYRPSGPSPGFPISGVRGVAAARVAGAPGGRQPPRSQNSHFSFKLDGSRA